MKQNEVYEAFETIWSKHSHLSLGWMNGVEPLDPDLPVLIAHIDPLAVQTQDTELACDYVDSPVDIFLEEDDQMERFDPNQTSIHPFIDARHSIPQLNGIEDAIGIYTSTALLELGKCAIRQVIFAWRDVQLQDYAMSGFWVARNNSPMPTTLRSYPVWNERHSSMLEPLLR